jgi:hypothetical protein
LTLLVEILYTNHRNTERRFNMEYSIPSWVEILLINVDEEGSEDD